MTENERDIILLNLNKKFDTMLEKVNRIDVMEKKVNQIDAIQEKVNQIDAMQNDINELKEETRRISKSVAVIEQEHGKKLTRL